MTSFEENPDLSVVFLLNYNKKLIGIGYEIKKQTHRGSGASAKSVEKQV